MKNNYTYSPKACVLKKSYGDIHLTVVIELPKSSLKKDGRNMALSILKEDINNLINDSELEKLLSPTKE